MEEDDTVENLHKLLELTKHDTSTESFPRIRSKTSNGPPCFRCYDWGHTAVKCPSKVKTVTISERINKKEDEQKQWFITGRIGGKKYTDLLLDSRTEQ